MIFDMTLGEAVIWLWLTMIAAVVLGYLAWALWQARIPEDQRLKMPPPRTNRVEGDRRPGRWNP